MSNCKVIAVVNQKGGVGETTTTFNLGVGLARAGKRVLLVDCDPQGDLTICCGYQDNDEIETTISTIMQKVIEDDELLPDEGIIHQPEGVDLLPANIELSSMDLQLVSTMNRERILAMYLNSIKDRYDYILLDCMPSLGMITVNAFTAADSVIIPVQAHYLPLKGMTQLTRTISKVRKQINPKLRIDGIVLTLVAENTNIPEPETTYAGKESVGIAVSTEKMLGDVDNDKNVTMLDVVMLQKHIASLTVLTPEQIRLADVNRDGEITMLDVTTMQKYIARIIEKF
ncbi:MAG: AAA family ATPase [Clostridiales bacterium]|nr:AAA family ATPase [Clostridiales bacterium]